MRSLNDWFPTQREYRDLHGPDCELIRSSKGMQLGYGSETARNCRGRLPRRITSRLPQPELRSFLGGAFHFQDKNTILLVAVNR